MLRVQGLDVQQVERIRLCQRYMPHIVAQREARFGCALRKQRNGCWTLSILALLRYISTKLVVASWPTKQVAGQARGRRKVHLLAIVQLFIQGFFPINMLVVRLDLRRLFYDTHRAGTLADHCVPSDLMKRNDRYFYCAETPIVVSRRRFEAPGGHAP